VLKKKGKSVKVFRIKAEKVQILSPLLKDPTVTAVYSEHVQVIRCNIIPRSSAERFIDH
jgi:hypothetical protein